MECPVNAGRKPVEGGYHTKDTFQRLLSLKRWIHNAYPPEAHFKMTSTGNDVVWNVPGIPDNQYLSSALVTPLVTEGTLSFTNYAYLSLLQCRLHFAETSMPLKKIPDDEFGGSTICPPDRYVA
jgi:hypothetical protein